MEDRRVAHRYKLLLPVMIRMISKTSTGELRSITRDVSTSGVYFTSDEPLTVGLQLALSLILPPEITQGSAVVIDAQARVTRVEEHPSGADERFGIAAVIDRFNVNRSAVDFALHKAEQVGEHRRPA